MISFAVSGGFEESRQTDTKEGLFRGLTMVGILKVRENFRPKYRARVLIHPNNWRRMYEGLI